MFSLCCTAPGGLVRAVPERSRGRVRPRPLGQLEPPPALGRQELPPHAPAVPAGLKPLPAALALPPPVERPGKGSRRAASLLTTPPRPSALAWEQRPSALSTNASWEPGPALHGGLAPARRARNEGGGQGAWGSRRRPRPLPWGDATRAPRLPVPPAHGRLATTTTLGGIAPLAGSQQPSAPILTSWLGSWRPPRATRGAVFPASSAQATK